MVPAEWEHHALVGLRRWQAHPCQWFRQNKIDCEECGWLQVQEEQSRRGSRGYHFGVSCLQEEIYLKRQFLIVYYFSIHLYLPSANSIVSKPKCCFFSKLQVDRSFLIIIFFNFFMKNILLLTFFNNFFSKFTQFVLYGRKWKILELIKSKSVSSDSLGQLQVSGHNGHSLGVDGAQVGVFEQGNEVGFSWFLKG